MVPMMWTFVIKTDGTKKARLVGRGDLMIPYIDSDPNAVYCGNGTTWWYSRQQLKMIKYMSNYCERIQVT
jgi:hypothetical protein